MSSPIDLDTQQSVILPINGPVAPDQYIVKLKDSVSTHDHVTFHFHGLVSPVKDVFASEFFNGETQQNFITFIVSQ